MVEKVHDIYDVVLKLIVFVYSIDFLRYIGVEQDEIDDSYKNFVL